MLENAGTAQLATMFLHQWWDSPFSEPVASRFGTGLCLDYVELRTFDDVLGNCRSSVGSFSRTACHQGLMSSSPLLTSGACRRQWPSGRFYLQEKGNRQVGLELGLCNCILQPICSGMNCCQSTWGPSSPVSWLETWDLEILIELDIELIQRANTLRKEFDFWFHTFSATEKSAAQWQVPILIDSEVSEAGIILQFFPCSFEM